MRGAGDNSDHYRGEIEPIDVIEEMGDLPAFCRSNIIKYVMRYRDKDGKKDLLKAQDYLQQLIDAEYPDDHIAEDSKKVEREKCERIWRCYANNALLRAAWLGYMEYDYVTRYTQSEHYY